MNKDTKQQQLSEDSPAKEKVIDTRKQFEEINVDGSKVVDRFLGHILRNELGQAFKMLQEEEVYVVELSKLQGREDVIEAQGREIEILKQANAKLKLDLATCLSFANNTYLSFEPIISPIEAILDENIDVEFEESNSLKFKMKKAAIETAMSYFMPSEDKSVYKGMNRQEIKDLKTKKAKEKRKMSEVIVRIIGIITNGSSDDDNGPDYLERLKNIKLKPIKQLLVKYNAFGRPKPQKQLPPNKPLQLESDNG